MCTADKFGLRISPFWCFILSAFVGSTNAQLLFPIKPVRLIVPTTPVGTTDALARLVSPPLTQLWGKQVVVDNRPGGHGIIGMDLLAKSPPDGHTLVMGNIGIFAINTVLYNKLPYDIPGDISTVALLAKQPFVLSINNALPVKTLQEFIRLAKSQPGKMSFGSAGNGSGTHVSMEMLKSRLGLDIVHVPYRGSGPVIVDLLAGQVQAYMTGAFIVVPYINAGKLKGLAVTSSKRLPIARNIPTFTESGIPQFEISQWQGMMAPAGVPPNVIQKINADVRRVMLAPEIQELMTREGVEIVSSSPEEFAAFLRSEIEHWGKVVKQAGVRVD